MTIDDAMLMAYADGELDPLAARRVEHAVAQDAALADKLASHRQLGAAVSRAFQPIAEAPVPDRLRAMLESNVVPLARSVAPPRRRWPEAIAIAASLVIGVAVGQRWQTGPLAVSGNRMVASGTLAHALDTQVADSGGTTRMLVSFRDSTGAYCRVFAAPITDGIACRDGAAWTLRRTQAPATAQSTQFRQAGSADAVLMAAAQEIMVGDPLDISAEKTARDRGWK